MLVKVLIVVSIIACVLYCFHVAFRLFAEITVFRKFKGQLDDISFDVKVQDETVKDNNDGGK